MTDNSGAAGVDEIIARAKGGDRGAVQALTDAFLPVLRNQVKRCVPPILVEDAMGEAALALFDALAAYDPDRNRPFVSYLRVVVRNHVKAWFADECAATYGLVSFDAPGGDEEASTLHDVTADPEALDPEGLALEAEADALRTVRLADARRELAALPAAERDVIERHVRGETLHAIGAARGASREAARQQWARGIGRLQTALRVAS